MPGAHRDLSMWKPLMADQMLKSFDLRKRQSEQKIDSYKWMVPIDFRERGHYYNAYNKHHFLNPKMTKPGKYGYNRSEELEKHGNLKSIHNIAGNNQVDPDFYK